MLKYKILCFLFCISGVLIVLKQFLLSFHNSPNFFSVESERNASWGNKKKSKISKSDLNVTSVTSIKATKFDMALSNSEKS